MLVQMLTGRRPYEAANYHALLFNGILTFFGSVVGAVPFLLDFFRLPSDLFSIFLVAGTIIVGQSLRVRAGDRLLLDVDSIVVRGGEVLALERMGSGQQQVRDGPQREDVRGAGKGAVGDLLRRHVQRRADKLTADGHPRLLQHSG